MKWKCTTSVLLCSIVFATACGAPAPTVTDAQIDGAFTEARARFEELGTSGDRLLAFLLNYRSIVAEDDARLARYGTTDSRLKIIDMVGMLDVEEFLTGELSERSRTYEANLLAVRDATLLATVFPEFTGAVQATRDGDGDARRKVEAYRKLDRFRQIEYSFGECSVAFEQLLLIKRVTPLETSMLYLTSPEHIARRFDGEDRFGDHLDAIIAGLSGDLKQWDRIKAICLPPASG